MVPFGERGGRCKSGDREKRSVVWDVKIHLVVFEEVDMNLEDTCDREVSSPEEDGWWSAVKISHDHLEPSLIPWRRTDTIRRIKHQEKFNCFQDLDKTGVCC